MKLEDGERIILKNNWLTSMLALTWYYEGVALKPPHVEWLVHIYLTNKRIYGELTLTHWKILDILLSDILEVRKERGALSDFVFITCRPGAVANKEKTMELGNITFSSGNVDLWLQKIQELKNSRLS